MVDLAAEVGHVFITTADLSGKGHLGAVQKLSLLILLFGEKSSTSPPDCRIISSLLEAESEIQGRGAIILRKTGYFSLTSPSRWLLFPIKAFRSSTCLRVPENSMIGAGFSGFHLIALTTELEVIFKRKESIVIRRGSIGPFSRSPALLKAGGSGDFEVAQLIRTLDQFFPVQ